MVNVNSVFWWYHASKVIIYYLDNEGYLISIGLEILGGNKIINGLTKVFTI